MKRILILTIPFLILSFTACTLFKKAGCAAESLVVTNLPPAIAGGLQCTNLTQIQTDIKTVVDKVGLCPAVKAASATHGTIANIACPLIAQGAVSLLGAQVPASWACNPTMVSQGLSAQIIKLCELIPL